MRCLTQQELRDRFGDPNRYMTADGGITPDWERAILTTVSLPEPLPLSWDRGRIVRTIRCHMLIADAMESALAMAHSNLAAWRTVNDFGGCYAWRTNRRDHTRLSAHAWGAAIDLDVGDNAQGRTPQVHSWIVRAFEQHGFVWGGNFTGKSRDGMHYEIGEG